MKKVIILLLTTLFLTGCTAVRIDTASTDNIINIILSKENKLYNKIRTGYKYYIPRGVTYIDSNEQNDKLYSNGTHYYLYVDIISYYYKEDFTYEEKADVYYSRFLNFDDKKGYLEINKDQDKYYIEFMYNYAKIEALVDEEDIHNTVVNITYILSTVQYNDQIIKTMLEGDLFNNKEKPYNIFKPKENSNNQLEEFQEEEYNNTENTQDN